MTDIEFPSFAWILMFKDVLILFLNITEGAGDFQHFLFSQWLQIPFRFLDI